MSVRLEDIAKAAGVSVMTVSRALRGIGRMRPETRTRIRETAVQMGYHAMSTIIVPSPTLSKKADYALRLLAPNIRNPVSAEEVGGWFLKGMVEGARRRLEISDGTIETRHFDTLEQTLEYTRKNKYHGVVILQPLPEPWICRLCETAAVVCLSEDSLYTSGVDTVRGNEAHAAARVVKELQLRGHRDVAWVGVLDRNMPARDFRTPGSPEDHSLSATLIARYGTWAMIEKMRIPGVRHQLYLEDRDWETRSLEEVIRVVLDRILAGTNRPSAIVSHSGSGAIEIYRQLRARGVRVPEEISLVSCGSSGMFPKGIPKISGTVTPVEQIGQVVPELIERRLANPDATPVGIRLENEWLEGKTLTAWK